MRSTSGGILLALQIGLCLTVLNSSEGRVLQAYEINYQIPGAAVYMKRWHPFQASKTRVRPLEHLLLTDATSSERLKQKPVTEDYSVFYDTFWNKPDA